MSDIIILIITGISSVLGMVVIHNLSYAKGFKTGYFEGYKDGGNYCIDRLNTMVKNDAP